MKRFHSYIKARSYYRGRALSVFCLGSALFSLVTAATAAPDVIPPTPAVAATSPAVTPPVAAPPQAVRRSEPPRNLAGYKPRIDVAGEREVRAQLQLAGFKDPALVEAVIVFVRQKGQARVVLSKTADELATALATPGYNAKKLSDLYDAFQVQLDEERDRTEKAEKELDTTIHWSVNKRLTATLLLAGIVGDATGFLNTPVSSSDSEEVFSPDENSSSDSNDTQ